jgi:transcription elongation GreA/GreB family factor
MPDQNLFDGTLPVSESLRQLRLRLLDLTARNRLLNFKPSVGKSIQIVNVYTNAVWDRAVDGQTLTIIPVPDPKKDEYVIVENRRQKPEPREYAKTLGINPSYELRSSPGNMPATGTEGKKLQALYYPEDLSRVCRKVFNHAKTAIEETGSNMLYLVFGFLEFYEDDASDKPLLAPLISVPVLMKEGSTDNQTGQKRYELTFTNEEITDNLSLLEKLKQQFNIHLPEFGENDSPDDYFETIEDLIRLKDRWQIRRQVVLSMLSFAKMVLVNDLDPGRWPTGDKGNSLTTHPLVKGVFIGLEEDRTDSDGQEFDVDEHPDNNLPLIYDADAYQHRALIDALAGKNMVINGPPGTGKSQTITNLISSGLQRGMKVLFISEKLAALQVVKSRLEMAGLGKFVLELHSNKTNKKRFLEELEDRMKSKFPEPHDLPVKLQAFEQRRLELKRYADTLNSIIGNELELTVHQILWAAEKNRQSCGDEAKALEDITVAKAPGIRAIDLDARLNAIRSLAKHYDEIIEYSPQHPWYGFFPVTVKPGDDLSVQQYLRDLISATEEVERCSLNLDTSLPEQVSVSGSKQARRLCDQVSKILPFPAGILYDLLPKLFYPGDPDGRESYRVIQELKKQIEDVTTLSGKIEGKLRSQSIVNEHSLDEVQGAVKLLGRYRLASTPIVTQRNLLEQITSATRTIEARIHFIEDCAKITGLPLTGTDDNLKQIGALVSIGGDALPELLGYRHAQLALPSAKESIQEARRTATEIAAQTASLNQAFYVDDRPDGATLSKSIQTLRQGDAWYRIFQREWRQAKKFYRGLARSKEKVSADKRLGDLESMAHFYKQRDQFNNSQDYKETFGLLFKGEATDFDKLERLQTWYAKSVSAMFELAIPPECFDLTTISPYTLAQLHKANGECQEHLAELIPASNYFASLITQHNITASQSLTERVHALTLAATEVAGAIDTVSKYIGDDGIPADTGTYVKDKLALDAALASIDANTQASALFGRHFAAMQTPLPPIVETFQWGVQVASGGLPVAVALRVLKADAEEYLPRLRCALKELAGAWDHVHAFAERMTTLGAFEWSQWHSTITHEEDETPLAIRERAEHALTAMDELLPWTQYNNARSMLNQFDASVFTDRLERGAIPSEKIEFGFLYRLYASIAQSIFRSRPELASFSTTKHNQIREEFGKLDKEIIKLRGKECAAKIAKNTQLAPGTRGSHMHDYTECELLYKLIPQQRPRVPIRQILKRAGKSVLALKPCLMMGPMAVAQYLEPGVMQFDLVVIDEASQLTPEEAIGAMGRTKQIVVVGDPKQLPPTNFFNRLSTTDDGDLDEDSALSTIAGQESILDVCRSLMPERMLQLHYRSRHESLIAFSNAKFYDGKLVVFPSPYPRSRSLGLQYHHIKSGVYQNKQNVPEANRVVDAIIEHMRRHAGDSLGVCTLNMLQRDLIEELLEKRIRAFPECDEYRTKWEAEGWPFFIKNLENVQGDERDVIFISTTFGNAPGANVPRQNFGPISRSTGWRRLNVLFTRARKAVHLYTSMQPEDIVVDQNTPEGTKVLRGYLDYARTGLIANLMETDREPDSDFEIAVADVLRAKGYSVRPQLGVAGYFIDMVVKHPVRPGEYIAAIECDGASYHSGAAVRDRDRIRQEILEGLGWKGKIWRIWSTDWFRNPSREIQKLIAFLDERMKECDLEPTPLMEEGVQEEDEIVVTGAVLDNTISQMVLSLSDDDEGVFVKVGDHVTYVDMADPETKLKIQIVDGLDHLDQGIINAARPLAQTILDAEEGDEVELNIPGRPSRMLKIVKIDRVG